MVSPLWQAIEHFHPTSSPFGGKCDRVGERAEHRMWATVRVADHKADIGFGEQRMVVLLIANGNDEGRYPTVGELVP